MPSADSAFAGVSYGATSCLGGCVAAVLLHLHHSVAGVGQQVGTCSFACAIQTEPKRFAEYLASNTTFSGLLFCSVHLFRALQSFSIYGNNSTPFELFAGQGSESAYSICQICFLDKALVNVNIAGTAYVCPNAVDSLFIVYSS